MREFKLVSKPRLTKATRTILLGVVEEQDEEGGHVSQGGLARKLDGLFG